MLENYANTCLLNASTCIYCILWFNNLVIKNNMQSSTNQHKHQASDDISNYTDNFKLFRGGFVYIACFWCNSLFLQMLDKRVGQFSAQHQIGK